MGFPRAACFNHGSLSHWSSHWLIDRSSPFNHWRVQVTTKYSGWWWMIDDYCRMGMIINHCSKSSKTIIINHGAIIIIDDWWWLMIIVFFFHIMDGEKIKTRSGWWFGTFFLWLSHHIGNVIIPTDLKSMIFQRGRRTNQYIPVLPQSGPLIFSRTVTGNAGMSWQAGAFRLRLPLLVDELKPNWFG